MNYSRPAYTGRPRAPGARGEGTALMHMLIDDLRHHRAPECHINVDEPDVDALRLYERLGFTNFESYGDTSGATPATNTGGNPAASTAGTAAGAAGWRMLCYIRELWRFPRCGTHGHVHRRNSGSMRTTSSRRPKNRRTKSVGRLHIGREHHKELGKQLLEHLNVGRVADTQDPQWEARVRGVPEVAGGNAHSLTDETLPPPTVVSELRLLAERCIVLGVGEHAVEFFRCDRHWVVELQNVMGLVSGLAVGGGAAVHQFAGGDFADGTDGDGLARSHVGDAVGACGGTGSAVACVAAASRRAGAALEFVAVDQLHPAAATGELIRIRDAAFDTCVEC
ncbi:GNAT family N-acetyltransferase [Corynebacterium aquatimens]